MNGKVWLSVALCAVMAAGNGLAQDERGPRPEGERGPRPGPGGGGMREMRGGPGPGEDSMMAGLRDLDLTPEQREKVAQIAKAGREQAQALMEQMRAARNKQFETINADVFDEAAVRAAVQASAKIEEELAVLRAKGAQELRTVLTPEQLTKLKELREQSRGRMREGLNQRRENRRLERVGEEGPKGPGRGGEAKPESAPDRLP